MILVQIGPNLICGMLKFRYLNKQTDGQIHAIQNTSGFFLKTALISNKWFRSLVRNIFFSFNQRSIYSFGVQPPWILHETNAGWNFNKKKRLTNDVLIGSEQLAGKWPTENILIKSTSEKTKSIHEAPFWLA